MDLHANRMIFADDEYCRAAMPLAIPGGIAHIEIGCLTQT